MTDRVVLRRGYRFSASHIYRRPDWTDQENRQRFGKCANVPGHGHNYRLTVGIEGTPDPETGFAVDLSWLDRTVAEGVLERLDHQHLNSAVAEFAPGGKIPSSENLVLWIRDQLKASIPPGMALVELRLAEDDDLAAEWRPGSNPVSR